MVRRRHSLGIRLLAVVTLSGGLVPTTQAGTVVPMSIQTIADYSGQVIDGRVTSVRSYWADHPRRIESEVTLEQVQYLKGASNTASSTFSVIVPGGTIGQTQMRIGGAPTLDVGQRWMLCLLPTYKTFPVVGLSQGAFRVEVDASGVARVLSAADVPITGIDESGFVVAEQASQFVPDVVDQSGHITVATNDGQVASPQAISREDFVAQLAPVLAASRTHNLAHPAGRRLLVNHTPVPLRNDDGILRALQRDRLHPAPLRVPAANRTIRPGAKAIRQGDGR